MNVEGHSKSYVLSTLAVGVMLLFAGGMIYVLYRPQTLLLFHVAGGLGMTDIIGQWRQMATAWHPAAFTVYCLPAGLWALSYVLIVGTLAQGLPAIRRWIAVAFIPLLGISSEVMQAVGIVPGTFDWTDLTLYALPLIAYATIITKT